MYGPLTDVTCAACANGTSALATRDRTAGEAIPWADRMASVSESPDWRGKCAFSTPWPGSLPLKLFCAGAPKAVHSMIRNAAPMIQEKRVSHRCR